MPSNTVGGLAIIIPLTILEFTTLAKAKYIDNNGNIVVPEKPNAYKFESFIFDAFDMLDDMAILRVKREEEFAPVKNAEGTDSPETARKLYENFYNNK